MIISFDFGRSYVQDGLNELVSKCVHAAVMHTDYMPDKNIGLVSRIRWERIESPWTTTDAMRPAGFTLEVVRFREVYHSRFKPKRVFFDVSLKYEGGSSGVATMTRIERKNSDRI